MMTSLIINSYLIFFLSIAAAFVLAIFLGLTWSFRKNRTKSIKSVIMATNEIKQQPLTISSKDISAIAGDDIIATQLDLARAYIETDRKHLAKKILQFVIQQGNLLQQQEAHRLINLL